MSTATDLLGLGVAPQLGAALGNQPSALTTTGTTQATAAAVLSSLVTLTTASSQTGAVISTNAEIGKPYFFFNSTSTTAVVYAPVGHTLNGGASTTGLSLLQNKAAIFIQVSKGVWASILTA